MTRGLAEMQTNIMAVALPLFDGRVDHFMVYTLLARRSLDDPYEDREAASRRRRLIFWLIVAALAASSIATRWNQRRTGRYFWEKPAAAAPSAAPAAK